MMDRAKSRSGFSLIVIALLLVVAGTFVITLFLPRTATQLGNVTETKTKLDKIKLALKTYAADNSGVYPCPASLKNPITSATFGTSVNACAAATVCVPVVGEIYCPGSTYTWVGAVPVRTLGLTDNYEYDGWGNRFTYVVSNGGSFPINRLNGTNITAVHIDVISHGPDGIGAFNRAGNQPVTCARTGATTTTSELENCNYSSDDTFISSTTSSATATFYDDMTFKY